MESVYVKNKLIDSTLLFDGHRRLGDNDDGQVGEWRTVRTSDVHDTFGESEDKVEFSNGVVVFRLNKRTGRHCQTTDTR